VLGNNPPAPNSGGGDLSPVSPVIYAHRSLVVLLVRAMNAVRMLLCIRRRDQTDWQTEKTDG